MKQDKNLAGVAIMFERTRQVLQIRGKKPLMTRSTVLFFFFKPTLYIPPNCHRHAKNNEIFATETHDQNSSDRYQTETQVSTLTARSRSKRGEN